MRKTLFKWHSYAALIAILPLVIISITGSILVFKVEIDTLLMPNSMQVQSDNTQIRQSLDTLMHNVKHAHADYIIGSWEIFETTRTDTAYLIKKNTTDWYKVYIDQYSGQVLSDPVGVSHHITDWLLDLHFRLLLGTTGIFVGAIISLLFIFLSISGVVLYKNFWLKFFTLRFKQANRIFFSDLHKMVGIASAPIMLILGITGAYWNIAETIHEVTEHVIEEPYYIQHDLYSPHISIEALYQDSKKQIETFKPTYALFPFEPERDITFFGEVTSNNPLNSEYASTVTYDKKTALMLNAMDVRTGDNTHAVVDSFRKLHFGYFAGIFSQILWCLFGLSPVILSFTGLYFYLKRKKAI